MLTDPEKRMAGIADDLKPAVELLDKLSAAFSTRSMSAISASHVGKAQTILTRVLTRLEPAGRLAGRELVEELADLDRGLEVAFIELGKVPMIRWPSAEKATLGEVQQRFCRAHEGLL